MPNETPTSIGDNIVQFDMSSQTFRNASVQCCNTAKGIAAGAMQYVPSFGPEGLFFVLRGANGGTQGAAHDLLDFATVSVFDPAKQEWWIQSTIRVSPVLEYSSAPPASTPRMTHTRCKTHYGNPSHLKAKHSFNYVDAG